jgi:hypothetical protein
MKSKILKNECELRIFAEKFKDRANDVSLSYLIDSKVRAYFDSKGEMVAGYASNLKRPLRYELWIPVEKRAQIPLFTSKNKLCELTCIWISSREGRISSEMIYLHSVIDALCSGAKYILGGTLSAAVFGIQTQSLPHLLYKGDTHFFGTSRQCWVYYASRWELIYKIMPAFTYSIFMGALGKNVYLGKARARARLARNQGVEKCE